jgi:hypothetical protein
MRLTLGVGSGLARRPGDPPGRIWGIGDRGPNIKIAAAVQRYGLEHLRPLAGVDGAKVLPRPDLGPTLAELQVGAAGVELVRTLRLTTSDGRPLSGLPLPGSREADMEPAFDLDGRRLPADPYGADTEAVVALSDGSFWVAEEYGPSLLKVDAAGGVRRRWTAAGLDLPGAEAVLPARALERRLNRGFEGLAVSADERRLYVGFQSALQGAGPGSTLIWTLDAQTGALLAEHLYPFDPPASFTADEDVSQKDLKVCELVCVGEDRLLVLERVTKSARIYRVELSRPALTKTLVFSTDDAPEVAADLEGLALVSDRELILATDNDFGVEGAQTCFYRLSSDAPL